MDLARVSPMCQCREPTNGAEVAARRLIALGEGSSRHGSSPGLDHAGSIRLRDSVVGGYCMQRATRRKPHVPVRPTSVSPALVSEQLFSAHCAVHDVTKQRAVSLTGKHAANPTVQSGPAGSAQVVHRGGPARPRGGHGSWVARRIHILR